MHNFVVAYFQSWIPISINPNQFTTCSSFIWKFSTPRMQKPLKVSHAGTNYYISNIELNISRITGPHATQNQFSGTAHFWVSFDLRSFEVVQRNKSENARRRSSSARSYCTVTYKLDGWHCYIPVNFIFQQAIMNLFYLWNWCSVFIQFSLSANFGLARLDLRLPIIKTTLAFPIVFVSFRFWIGQVLKIPVRTYYAIRLSLR